MAKGDIVLIRARTGEPGVRRIWDDTTDGPFVCIEDYWVRWERQQVEPVCWQVTPGQVYQMDDGLASRLQQAYESARNGDGKATAKLDELWRQAKPYGGSS